MSENKKIYNNSKYLINIDELISSHSQCVLPLSDPNYISPTPEQIKGLRLYLGLSQAKLGYFLGKTVTSKGCSIIRKWETAKDKKEHREIDANAWRRMLYVADLASPADDFKLIL